MTKAQSADIRRHHMDTGRRAAIHCPHCASALRVRSNRPTTDTCRDLYLQCFNVECGATYRGQLTIVNGITASQLPRDGVEIRMAPPRRRVPANDTHPPSTTGSGQEVPHAANDDELLGEAIG